MKQVSNGFQWIDRSYMVPTHKVSDYLGETLPVLRKPRAKEDLKKLIELAARIRKEAMGQAKRGVILSLNSIGIQ